MRQGAEAGHIRYLGHIVFPLLQKLGGTVEPIPAEEHARILARKSFHLIIELVPLNVLHGGHAGLINL